MASWLAQAAIGGAIALAITNAETNLLNLSGTDPTSSPPGKVSRQRAGLAWVVAFDTVEVMRVHDGKITDPCGVASLYSAVPQLGPKP
jgi:hypothetical protein